MKKSEFISKVKTTRQELDAALADLDEAQVLQITLQIFARHSISRCIDASG